MPAPWVLPVAMAVGSTLVNMAQNWRARKVNEGYVRQQNEYNSPRSQMARFQAAGLNPHLVYGQGSPGNQATTLSQPDMSMGTDAVNTFNQSRIAQTQADVGQARISQSRAVTEVNRLQAEVLRRNPLLNDTAFESIIDSFVSSAKTKAAEAAVSGQRAEWMTGAKSFNVDGVEMHGPAGAIKMETELKLLEQKFRLGELDKDIKAEVLNSKEFQNAILEVQEKFMTDGKISPQHILDFVKLLLIKVK